MTFSNKLEMKGKVKCFNSSVEGVVISDVYQMLLSEAFVSNIHVCIQLFQIHCTCHHVVQLDVLKGLSCIVLFKAWSMG